MFFLMQTNVCDNIYLERRSDTMKKKLLNLGGLVLFYTSIFMGVLLLNLRFTHINEIRNVNDVNEDYIAMNI